MSNSDHTPPSWRRLVLNAHWPKSGARPVEADDDEGAPATQFAQDRDDYLGDSPVDIGRKTGVDEHEIFVASNPAPALQQLFEQLRPEFITVHDVGTSSSRKLLDRLAFAGSRRVQTLRIRRQGHGTSLATVHFVELPCITGASLRVYSTDCETEPHWRPGVALMLLAFSRLGVVMVGDLNPDEISALLGALRDSMLSGPWQNHQLMLLPLGSSSSLVTPGMELARGTGVNVRTTPQVTRATDAWGFISGAWNRMTDKLPSRLGPLAPLVKPASPSGTQPQGHISEGATAALSGEGSATGAPAPAASSSLGKALYPVGAPHHPPLGGLRNPATAALLRRYVEQISELGGVMACSVFDAVNGESLAFAGVGPSASNLAARGAELLAAVMKASDALGLGRSLAEVALSVESHHLLLRGVPGHPGLVMHTVLDKASANVTLTRLQIQRMDSLFEATG